MSKFQLLFFALLSIQSFALHPVAVFYYAPIGDKVTFQADLSIGNIQTFTWDFGDGSPIITTTSKNIDHYFPSATYWKVTLTVTDSANHQATVQNLVLSPTSMGPKIDFTITSVLDDQVLLNAADKGNDGFFDQYFWDMGDGKGIWTTTSSSFNYSYILGGTYTITLKGAHNSRVNSTSVMKTVFVNHAPVPQFDFDINGHEVTLNGGISQDPDGFIKFYCWNFGDNQLLVNDTTKTVAVHQYSSSGIYQVNLTVTDNLGKSASIQHSFLIDLPPKPQIVIIRNIDDDLTLNAGQTWTDNNSSIVQLVWDWGDNVTTISTDKNANVLHSYERGGVYTITLTAKDTYGVSSLTTLTVLVNTVPRVDFEALKIVNDTIILESLSQDIDGEIINYSWNFGDSSDSSSSFDALIMNHTYLLGGTYNICLTVTDNMNGQNTSCQQFFLNRDPQSQFKIVYNQDDQIILEDDGSSDFDGTITSYSWDFGDGNSEENVNSPSVTHNYTWGGYYNVSLTVVDNLGGQHTSIVEIEVNTVPVSEFIVTQLGNDIILIDASFSSDIDGHLIEYAWDLGDGTFLITEDPILQHQYSLGDTYSISLTVKDNMNATSLIRTQDVFVDIVPVADFEIIGMLDNAWVIVTAKPYLSQRSTRDLDGTISSVIWNFGDGSTNITNQTYATQMHQYTIGGNFTISLYAVDNNGVISAQSQKTIFLSKPPQAAFDVIANASGYAILDAQSSYDVDGYITSYCWNFGDGSNIQCTSSPSMTYLYNSSGNYNISLSVLDNVGLKSSIAHKSFSVNQAPYALFEVLEVLSTGLLTVKSSPDDSVDLDGYITQYVWNFGDNTSLVTRTNNQLTNTSQIQHLYAKSGFYNVTLQVVDNLNATNSITIPILILLNDGDDDDNNISQEFDPSSDNYLKVTNQTIPSFPTNSRPAAKILSWIEGYTVYFSAQASSDADGYIAIVLWDLGDAVSQSNERLFSYTYPRGGPYNVSLKVTDNLGASSTTFQIINLNYAPQAFFKFEVIDNVTLQLDASNCFDVDGNITSYKWDFGDGKSLVKNDGYSFNYTFASMGIYAVKLVVQDNMGAENTFVVNINMQGPPEVRRIVTGLPIKANLMNVATSQYLSFTYSMDLSTSDYFMTDSSAFTFNTTMITQDSNLRLYRNSQNSTYYIMNANGLALDIKNQEVQVSLQKGGSTTTFIVLRYANYYQFVDSETGLYLAVSEDDASVLKLVANSSSALALWNLVVLDNTPLN